jgi:GTP-binding protein
MRKPIVAVVGRPNVGKSTFFNYLVGRRISIVEDTPGVTRDRIYADVEWRNKQFTLIDTGGIEPYSADIIMQQMKRQAELALAMADVIIFMVDSRSGVTASDKEVATLIRKTSKPVLLVVNKVDNVGQPPAGVYEFYNLGLGDLHIVSSIHGLGMGDLLDEVYEKLIEIPETEDEEEYTKIAIVGKPNAGKSSLINKILGEDRVIVSDVPGTTRDAIDTYVEQGDKKYIFIDTAGIRRKSKVNEDIERYSVMRAWAAVERADVCLIVIDATEGVTEQDTKVAGFAHEAGKACIFVINKWDLVEKSTGTLETYRKKVQGKFSFMQYAPSIFISAKTGQRVNKLYELIDFVAEQAAFRVSTGMLNDILNDAIAMVQPPSDKGKRLKVYYMTQISVKPPTFVLFINNLDLMHYSYERYIENQLRKVLGFEGTPIRFKVRQKNKE